MQKFFILFFLILFSSMIYSQLQQINLTNLIEKFNSTNEEEIVEAFYSLPEIRINDVNVFINLINLFTNENKVSVLEYKTKKLVKITSPSDEAKALILKNRYFFYNNFNEITRKINEDLFLKVLDFLGSLEDEEAIRIVLRYLTNPNPRIKNQVITIIENNPKIDKNNLRLLIDDRDPDIKARVIKILGDLRNINYAKDFLSGLRDTYYFVSINSRDALIKLGNQAVPMIVPLLSDLSHNTRYNAYKILCELKAPGYERNIINGLQDSFWLIKLECIDAVSTLKLSNALPILTNLLQNNNIFVREKASNAILIITSNQ